MMELPPDSTTDKFVIDTLGTRKARRQRWALPWVPMVLCGVVLVGILSYQSLQVRRLRQAFEQMTEERDLAYANLGQSREAQAKFEQKFTDAEHELEKMGEAIKEATALTSNNPGTPRDAATVAKNSAREAELEKLVIFLRDELKASSQTIDQLKAKAQAQAQGQSSNTTAASNQPTPPPMTKQSTPES